MRKRKLYLSELLHKTLNKNHSVRITRKNNTILWYQDVTTCLQEIYKTTLWNSLVIEWSLKTTIISQYIDIKVDVD